MSYFLLKLIFVLGIKVEKNPWSLSRIPRAKKETESNSHI